MATEASITLLVGSDAWLAARADAERKVAEEWVHIRSDEHEPGRIYRELRSFNFFGVRRAVWIDRVDQLLKDEVAEVAQALQAPAPDLRVFLTCGTEKRDKISEWLPKATQIEIEPSAAEKSKTLLASVDVRLDDELKDLLVELYGDHPQILEHELSKLALFAPGGSASLDDWRAMSIEPGAVDGFRFARAVVAGNLGDAERILRAWTNAGGEAHTAGRELIGAMSYVLRQVLAYRLARAQGHDPRSAQRRVAGRFGDAERRAADRWTLRQAAAALSGLMRLDRQLKSSAIPADLALFAWLASITAHWHGDGA